MSRATRFALPILIAAGGIVWMHAATAHFEERTGRALYGLAGQHASHPEWTFDYHPGNGSRSDQHQP